jgi:hypothetical protein
MSHQNAFSMQILAFHDAIVDDCNRAARAEQTDAMALRLRNNALALAKLQLAMLAAGGGVGQPEPVAPPAPDPVPRVERTPDRILSGDALSRFVSRRLEPGESPHSVWQDLHAADPGKPRRNPVSRGAGFRSPSG